MITASQRAALSALVKHVKHGTPAPDSSALPSLSDDSPELTQELTEELRSHVMAVELLKGRLVCQAPGCGFEDPRGVDLENP